MSIAIVVLSDSAAASTCELLTRHVWKRDWSEELAQTYFAWRYTSRPKGETLLALDRVRCIAMVDTFLRPYWIGGCRRPVRETCDWFCLPAYRPLGIGLHLMRQVMNKPEPTIAIGGTDQTCELLPRLRWASLPEIYDYALPASAKTAASFLARSGCFAWRPAWFRIYHSRATVLVRRRASINYRCKSGTLATKCRSPTQVPTIFARKSSDPFSTGWRAHRQF